MPSGKFKIEAINPSFKGMKDGVEFVDGVGFTDNEMIRKRFEEQFRDLGIITTDVASGKQIFPIVPGGLYFEEEPTSLFGNAPIEKKVSE